MTTTKTLPSKLTLKVEVEITLDDMLDDDFFEGKTITRDMMIQHLFDTALGSIDYNYILDSDIFDDEGNKL